MQTFLIFLKAVIEGIKAAFFYDVGKTKAELEAMKNAEKIRSIADVARRADSVPDDQDPYNRSK
jgi:hypothetical protein